MDAFWWSIIIWVAGIVIWWAAYFTVVSERVARKLDAKDPTTSTALFAAAILWPVFLGLGIPIVIMIGIAMLLSWPFRKRESR